MNNSRPTVVQVTDERRNPLFFIRVSAEEI